MTGKVRAGAVIGFVLGAVAGYLFFNDSDSGVLLGTVLPTLVLAVAAAAVGYFLVRQTAPRATDAGASDPAALHGPDSGLEAAGST